MKAGEQLSSYLDELSAQNGHSLVIVETGCLRRTHETAEADDGWSTLYFAQWCEAHPGSKMFSVDIERRHIETAGRVLAEHGIRPEFPIFTLGESVAFLEGFGGNVDFAYLDSCDGWEHGLAEFKAAESKGARMIVMDDYISKVVLAKEYAEKTGWKVKQEGRFTVMRK